jgi:pseudaminic acid cytidylyltransferase
MSNICIIPARGGSKRIHKKNIKLFFGKPIVSYSIEAAIKSQLFDEVMVSTDDEEIAGIAQKFGAKVPFLRNKKTSDDFATTFEVVEEVLFQYQNSGQFFDNICCIYPCAPFITSLKLQTSYKLLVDNNYDTVLPIIQFGFPTQRALIRRDDKIVFIHPENSLKRSQDLEETYHDAGQFYWMRKDTILLRKQIYTSNTGYIIISEMEGQDIDNKTDWDMAELKYKLNNK